MESRSDRSCLRDQWFPSILAHLPAAAFSLLLFLIPLIPDIRLSRPKLLLIEIGLFSILALWLLINFSSRTFTLQYHSFLPPLLLYVSFITVYSFFSPDCIVALNEALRMALCFLSYFLALQLFVSDRLRARVIAFWISGASLAVIYGILQHFGGISFVQVPVMERVSSTFGNPIFFAAFLISTIPLAAGMFLTSRHRLIKALLFFFVIGCVYALYLTATRAALLGFLVSVLFFVCLVSSLKIRWFVIPSLVLLAALFALSHPALITRPQAHLLIWRDTLTMWLAHPFIGTGPGTFHLYFPQFASDALREIWPQGQCIINDAHNEYLQVLAETGIIGAGFMIALFCFFFAGARRTLQSLAGDRRRFMLAGIIASIAALLVENFFSVDMRFIVSGVFLFLLMGLADSFTPSRTVVFSLAAPLKAAGLCATAAAAVIAISGVIGSYAAQQKYRTAPDFFDEKLLEPAKTIRELESLTALYPDQAAVYEKLGWVYAKEKNWDRAIAALQKAAALDPKRAGPLNNLGNIYYLLGDTQNAAAFWQRALTNDPRLIDSRLNLATACFYDGRLKEAAAQLQAVLRLDPKNEKAAMLLKEMTE